MANVAKTNNAAVSTKKPLKLNEFFAEETVMQNLKKVMGKNAQSMVTSALQVCMSNAMLKNATNKSVYGAIMTAATLNLPINNNLGFAYIVPFNNRKLGATEAQFQIGYKGLIQLAKRSGQVKRIATTPIYNGQLIKSNPLTGFEFDFEVKGSEVIGFAAYYEEINGFVAESYVTVEEINTHASRYSQTFKKGYGVWKDQFNEMAQKTVLKKVLSKYATLSIELQDALQEDQAVVNDDTIDYPDNETIDITENVEEDRVLEMIDTSETLADLNALEPTIAECSDKIKAHYDNAQKEMSFNESVNK